MSDFYDSADETPPLGPVFTAAYDTDSACCADMIEEGDRARADGYGGWIHANGRCDAEIKTPSRSACGTCFTIHAGECL